MANRKHICINIEHIPYRTYTIVVYKGTHLVLSYQHKYAYPNRTFKWYPALISLTIRLYHHVINTQGTRRILSLDVLKADHHSTRG